MKKITIVSSATQKKYVIETDATTLAELKRDLDSNNISYGGMTFLEGLSKTELKSDESLLPKDIPYKGAITNDLIFLLSSSKSKISSGLSRTEAYDKIKELGLQEEVKNTYGRNFTVCSTDDLNTLIEKHTKVPKEKVEKVKEESLPCKEESKEVVNVIEESTTKEDVCQTDNTREILFKLIGILYDNDLLSNGEKNILVEVEEVEDVTKPNNNVYSDNEIDSLFDFQ